MKRYVFIVFILGILLGFGTSVIANGYLTGWSAGHTGTVAGNLIALSAESDTLRIRR